MASVVSSFSTSLDGFIADPEGQVGPLFDWYFNGDVEIKPPGYPITFRMSKPSAQYWQEFTESAERGAFVCGRRVFDLTNGWDGNPPMGRPTFVVTHRPPPEGWPPRPDAPFTFVTDGLESALEQAKAAGDGGVGVSGANIVQQCLNAGLLDEVRLDLVPVLLGQGILYFDNIDNTAVEFERVQVVEGLGVTHLRYRVKYH
jgi:dihydrofolate reductase